MSFEFSSLASASSDQTPQRLDPQQLGMESSDIMTDDLYDSISWGVFNSVLNQERTLSDEPSSAAESSTSLNGRVESFGKRPPSPDTNSRKKIPTLTVGQTVSCNRQFARDSGPVLGTISQIHSNGTYEVDFQDGMTEDFDPSALTIPKEQTKTPDAIEDSEHPLFSGSPISPPQQDSEPSAATQGAAASADQETRRSAVARQFYVPGTLIYVKKSNQHPLTFQDLFEKKPENIIVATIIKWHEENDLLDVELNDTKEIRTISWDKMIVFRDPQKIFFGLFNTAVDTQKKNSYQLITSFNHNRGKNLRVYTLSTKTRTSESCKETYINEACCKKLWAELILPIPLQGDLTELNGTYGKLMALRRAKMLGSTIETIQKQLSKTFPFVKEDPSTGTWTFSQKSE